MEAWPTSKMTSNLPKLGLISFLSLSRTQKTVCPKIPKIWDALRYILSAVDMDTGLKGRLEWPDILQSGNEYWAYQGPS